MTRTAIYGISALSFLAIGIAAFYWFPNGPAPLATTSIETPVAAPVPMPVIRGDTQIVHQKSPPQSEIDTSAVGTPFTVSASVENDCKLDKTVCSLVSQQLEKFSQEGRDTAWADQAEADLQDYIASRGTGKFLIRNIECRATICVVEVASLFGQYLPMDEADQVKYGLIDGHDAWGSEPDPTGVEIAVTLTTYTRR